jgi:SET domain-containing protein
LDTPLPATAATPTPAGSALPFFRCEPISVELISPTKGRGVRAGRDFRRGELIERAPVLIIPPEHETDLFKTVLDHYCLGLDDGRGCIPLGYCVSFLNHSDRPNVELHRSAARALVEVVALRDITAGEELVFRYREIWFDPE